MLALDGTRRTAKWPAFDGDRNRDIDGMRRLGLPAFDGGRREASAKRRASGLELITSTALDWLAHGIWTK